VAPSKLSYRCARPLARSTLQGNAINALRTQRDEARGSAWRRDLGAKIAWTMVAKVLALAVLWLLFFRGHAS
jgi:hypothetical protein